MAVAAPGRAEAGAVRRRLPVALVALVALCVPVVLLGNGLWLLLNDWYVHAEYARPGFPDDRYGLAAGQRTALALVGLDAIHPLNGDGVQVLREARLPDGQRAFTEDEVFHMSEVRGLVGAILLAHAIALATVLAALALAWRLRLARVARRGLLAGAGLTLAIAAVLGIYMLARFDDFFVQFHEALFTGDTWRFPTSATLIRLYPDAFWSDFAGVLAGLTLLQALLLGGGVWWYRRRAQAAAVRPSAGDAQPTSG